MKTSRQPNVVVVGTGSVGMAFAYGLIFRRLAAKLTLVDLNRERAEGEAIDLLHGTTFLGPMDIQAGGYGDCEDADVVIICAGVNQKPGQSRLELLQINAGIIRDIVLKIEATGSTPIILVATNPVDVLTAVAIDASRQEPGRVFGSGTVLDTARFRHVIAEHCRVDARSVHAHVLGEHGDTEVCVWSTANISNIPLDDFCRQRNATLTQADKDRMAGQVRDAAYEIINRKGATAYGIGVALCRILEGLVRDEHAVLTVSVPTGGVHGLPDVCLSLPCVLDSSGVEQHLETWLSELETEQLHASAKVLRESLDSLG